MKWTNVCIDSLGYVLPPHVVTSRQAELEAKRIADAEAARLADVARQTKAAERRDRMDEVKAKIKSASRKGKAVGLPAMLGVNLNFGPEDGGDAPVDEKAETTPAETTGYVPDGLTPEQYAAIKAQERNAKNLGAWGSKVGGASGPQRGDLMSQPTIWTDPAKFFREDQKLKYEAAQSDASRPNIYASGETSFEQWQSKLIDDLSKKPTPEPAPVAEEVDPEAAEAKNQEIVQALGAVAAAGAGALVVAGVVEAEAAIATGTAAAAVLGTVVSSAVAAKQAADDDEVARPAHRQREYKRPAHRQGGPAPHRRVPASASPHHHRDCLPAGWQGSRP